MATAFPNNSITFPYTARPLSVPCLRIKYTPLSSTINDGDATTKTTSPPVISIRHPRRPSTIHALRGVMIDVFVKPSVRPWEDPRHVLAGNCAPVDEHPPAACEIISTTGKLPPCLDGAYLRNGPNPQFLPLSPYTLFDGDGMLHCLRISGGGSRAAFSSRFVCTNKYKTERHAGASIVPNPIAGLTNFAASVAAIVLFVARIAAGMFDLRNGYGVANTSLTMIGGRLFALCESDLPYEVAVTANGDVVTIGRCDFNGELSWNMTAHPKLDPFTREIFAFRYWATPPFLTYFRFDAAGNKVGADVPIFSLTRPTFIHDFAITGKYAIFGEIHLGANPAWLIRLRSLLAGDSSEVSRIGVLPRYATNESEIQWVEALGINFIHTINAWDEIDPITGFEYITLVVPNITRSDVLFVERMELVNMQVEKIIINLQTSVVSRVTVSNKNLELATINPKYTGRENRYVYAGVGDPLPRISGVVKLDLREESTVAERMFGERCYGGEPFFIEKDPDDDEAEEDDGYVVLYVHDEERCESKFVVMDARSPELEVVAEVKLPQRVPCGFHGIFVREEHLN